MERAPSAPAEGIPGDRDRIFISYRRSDSGGWANLLYDKLTASFGETGVFMDTRAFRDAGPVDWFEALTSAIASSAVVIVVIGPDWGSSPDSMGRRRIHEPEDIVCMEIATALAHSIPVMPLLVGGAAMPRRSDLPDAIQSLWRLQAQPVRAETADEDIQRIIGIIQGTLGVRAGLGSAYLAHVARRFREWDTKWTPLEVTYNLRLATWEGQRYTRPQGHPVEENLGVREAVEKYDQLVIVGEPGSGKTTAVRRMALELAEDAIAGDGGRCPVPVVVPLNLWSSVKHAESRDPTGLSLVRAALASIDYPVSEQDLRRAVYSQCTAFFFDGLNEVPYEDRPACARMLVEFVENIRSRAPCRMVITSRKHNYRDYFGLKFETVEILELAPSAIQDYLERYLGSPERARDAYSHLDIRLRRLLQNPLLLSFAAELYERTGAIPRSRGVLIRDCVNLVLRRESRSQAGEAPTDPAVRHAVLLPIGYHMQTAGQLIPFAQAREIIKEALSQLPGAVEAGPDGVLEGLCDCQILERVGNDVRFWHQAVQEYFAACEMAEAWRARGNARDYISDPKWHEPLAIMAGLLADEEVPRLVRQVRQHNVLLAGMCVSNAESLPVEDELSFVRFLENRLARVCLLPENCVNILALASAIAALGVTYLVAHWQGRDLIIEVGRPLKPLFSAPLTALVAGARRAGFEVPYGVELAVAVGISYLYLLLISRNANMLIPRVEAWVYRAVVNRSIMPTLSALRYIGLSSDTARSALSAISVSAEDNPYMPRVVREFLRVTRSSSVERVEELLAMLQAPQSQSYAIQMLGETASDEAVPPLEDLAVGSDEIAGAGAVLALQRIAQRLAHVRPRVIGVLRRLCGDRTMAIATRRLAYRALVRLSVDNLPPAPRFTLRDLRHALASLVRFAADQGWYLGTVAVTLLAAGPGLLLAWWIGSAVLAGIKTNPSTYGWWIVDWCVWVAVVWWWERQQAGEGEAARRNRRWLRAALALISLPLWLAVKLPQTAWAGLHRLRYR